MIEKDEVRSIFRTDDPMQYIEREAQKSHFAAFCSKDPLDRALSFALDLALSEVVDPLDVDLSKFSSIYMEKVKSEDEVDFVTAGKMVLMAWSLLKLQSDLALREANSDQIKEEEVELDLAEWGWLSDDESFDFTKQVLTSSKSPISERLTRKAARKVTLADLIEALKASKRELRRRERRRDERERQKLMRSSEGRERVAKGVLDEILEKLDTIWSAIRSKKRVKLDELYEGKDELAMAFGSVLQLASDGKVRLEQENFPFGDIWVEDMG